MVVKKKNSVGLGGFQLDPMTPRKAWGERTLSRGHSPRESWMGSVKKEKMIYTI